MTTRPEANEIACRSRKNNGIQKESSEEQVVPKRVIELLRTKENSNRPPPQAVCNNQAYNAGQEKQLKRVRRYDGSHEFGSAFQQWTSHFERRWIMH